MTDTEPTLFQKLNRRITNNSDVLNFTLGIFIGLMVVNTADVIANTTLTAIGTFSYVITKLVGNTIT